MRGPCHIFLRHSTPHSVLCVLCPDSTSKMITPNPASAQKMYSEDVYVENHINLEDTGSHPGSPWVSQRTQKQQMRFVLSIPLQRQGGTIRVASRSPFPPTHGPCKMEHCDSPWYSPDPGLTSLLFYAFSFWGQVNPHIVCLPFFLGETPFM